jgi:hypothetical protein
MLTPVATQSCDFQKRIDTDLTLEQSRRAFSIGDWMTTADLDDTFSTKGKLRAQEAEVASERP